jgi:hypothetical protein
MSNTSASPKGKNQKILVIFGGVILLALLILIIVLSLAQANQKKAAAATLQAIPVQSTNVVTQENTPEVVGTATTTILTPEATHASVPPTATQAAPLAIAENGLQIRCLAIDSSLPIDAAASFSDTLFAVSEIAPTSDGIKLTIPVRACAVFVTFTQPLSEDVQVEVFEASGTQAWYTRSLIKDEQSENTYFAVLSHQYIIDPPYWNLNYRMSVQGTTQTYWEGALLVSRIFNGLCWEGSIPDPVTLKCPDADKLEREPHPDMPTLVPGGIQN